MNFLCLLIPLLLLGLALGLILGLEKRMEPYSEPTERLKYYLGPVLNKKYTVGPTTKFYGKPLLVDQNIMAIRHDSSRNNDSEYGFDTGPYLSEMKEYYSMVAHKGYRYLFAAGDVNHANSRVPWLAKTRPIHNRGASVLLPFNKPRHWYPLRELIHDIPWEEKRDILMWRGADTGRDNRVGIERYAGLSGEDWCDVGFTSMFNKHYEGRSSRSLLKPRMSIPKMLQYRYLLSLEGNDVASNLKWILASNSVCLMPPPTMESWLMEGRLQPWIHYIPVRRDLRDLREKVRWAQNNEKECLKIVKNANKFMSQFTNGSDLPIIKEILNTYGKNVRIKY